jgi:pimeloyl-ACP methyl ester carboxylesterase
VRRGWKIVIGVLVGLAVLLALNTIATNSETKDAEVRVDGAELLQLDGGDLQVLDTGAAGDPNAPPIVLLHCFGCAIDWWDEMVPVLSRERRVVAIDLLGFGGSEKPGSGYGMEEQSSLVAQALSRLGVEGATVVGHSLGATVATALAEQSRELVDRLVIVDQAPDDSFGDIGFLAKLGMTPVIGQAMWRVTPDFAIEDGFGDAFAPGYDVPDAFVDDFRQMTYTSFDTSPGEERDYTDEQPLDDRISAALVPLLAIFGSEDQIYDARGALSAYAGVPGARTELIQGSGHSPNVEAPVRTARLILDFSLTPPAPEPQKPEEPRVSIEEDGRLAGTLVVTPPAAQRGETIRVTVRNTGEVRMLFGLGNRVEKRVGGGWRDATKVVFGTTSPPVRDILLSADPGKATGPRYNAVTDEIRLPEDLRPGIYRVIKLVAGPSKGGRPGPSTKLDGVFVVRVPPGQGPGVKG